MIRIFGLVDQKNPQTHKLRSRGPRIFVRGCTLKPSEMRDVRIRNRFEHLSPDRQQRPITSTQNLETYEDFDAVGNRVARKDIDGVTRHQSVGVHSSML